MVPQGEVESLIDLDLDFLRSYAQTRPDPWGTSQPHNAYEETPVLQCPVIGHETRLDSGDITIQSVFHQSVMYYPAILKSPEDMITMTLIADSFGPGFAPQYSVLNEFEQYCKDHWDTGVRTPLNFFSFTLRSCYSCMLRPGISTILGSLSDRNG